jgi:hypothetical protein
MKTLYEAIQNSINSDKKSTFKSFNIKDIYTANPSIKLNKILNIKKMKDYIASNSNIVVFSRDNDASVFYKFLCTIEFTIKEWEILKNAPNPEDVDLLLKNKLKPFIKEKTVNDYTFLVDEEQILISTEPGVRPKELIGEYTYDTTIVWFDDNFEF